MDVIDDNDPDYDEGGSNAANRRLSVNMSVAGCLFESSRGQYVYDAICDLARDYGCPGIVPIRDGEGNLTDYGIEQSNDAETWLNENIAAEGWSFGWQEGEFYYLPNEIWAIEMGG